jgi:hypothetical protein
MNDYFNLRIAHARHQLQLIESGSDVQLHLENIRASAEWLRATQRGTAGESMSLCMSFGVLGLGNEAVDALWLLCAAEVDASIRDEFRLQQGVSCERIRMTAYFLNPGAAVFELSENGMLAQLGLITHELGFAGPLQRVVRPSLRALALVLGDDSLTRWLPHATIVERSFVDNSASAFPLVTALIDDTGQRCIEHIEKQMFGAEVSRYLHVCTAERIGGAFVEARLRRLPLVFQVPMMSAVEYQQITSLAAAMNTPCVVVVAAPCEATKLSSRICELPHSEHAGVADWAQALGAEAIAQWAASEYWVSKAQVAAIGIRFDRNAVEPMLAIQQIMESLLAPALDGVAERVVVTQDWADLILPDAESAQVVELVRRMQHRVLVYDTWGFGDKTGKGRGLTALLSGPPGTGKTMIAGLLAKSMGLELRQIDVSKVVSKYIGETEKQLAQALDAAECGHTLLLFDEADSLFGKRTEVKSSNDRYANQGVNFLLQRIEQFNGLCVLTTNHESSIDEAFRRRLAMHIKLPAPEAGERSRIWERMIPAKVPVAGDFDFGRLGRQFDLAGGYIKNAVLRGAFYAATESEPLQYRHLMAAAYAEMEGMGRLVTRYNDGH